MLIQLFNVIGRWFVLALMALLAVAYDISVAEFSGDLRWLLLHGTAFALMAGYLLAGPAWDPRRLRQAGLFAWLAFGLLIWSALSWLWTMNPYQTWWHLKHLIGYIVLGGFVCLLRDERWYRRLLWVVVGGMTLNCLLGLTQYYNIGDAAIQAVFPPWRHVTAAFTGLLRFGYTMDGTSRALGGRLPFLEGDVFLDYFRQTAPPAATLANRNLLGSYLVITLPAAAFLALSGRGLLRRLPAAALLGLGLLVLAYTRSRAGWLALACAGLFVLVRLVCLRRQRKMVLSYFSRWLWGGLVLLVVAAVLLGNLRGAVQVGRVGLAERLKALSARTADEKLLDSVAVRLAYDLNALAMIRDRPLTGVGLGAFYTAYPAYHQAVRPTPHGGFSPNLRPRRMHNDPGQAAVELGLPGLLLYMALLFTLLWMSRRIGERTQSREVSLMALCLAAGVFGLGINSLADFPLQLPLSATLLWCYAGMLAGLYRLHVIPAAAAPAGDVRAWQHGVCLVLAGLLVVAGWWIVREDLARRRGAQYLQGVMARARAGLFDDPTLRLLRRSMAHYRRNTRLQEYRALVYANYRGSDIQVDTARRIREVEDSLRYDPHSPHKLINLGGLYMRRARKLLGERDYAGALEHARRAERFYEAMLAYPDFFADQTYTLGGMAHIMQGALLAAERPERWQQGRLLLQQALALNPRNAAARDALQRLDRLPDAASATSIP